MVFQKCCIAIIPCDNHAEQKTHMKGIYCLFIVVFNTSFLVLKLEINKWLRSCHAHLVE